MKAPIPTKIVYLLYIIQFMMGAAITTMLICLFAIGNNNTPNNILLSIAAGFVMQVLVRLITNVNLRPMTAEEEEAYKQRVSKKDQARTSYLKGY